MRRRFFFIILIVLATVSTVVVGLHSMYLKQARLSLIDRQIRQTAAALVNSTVGELRRREDFSGVNQELSEELGEDRIGKFFVMRNDQGDVIFESHNSKILRLVNVPIYPRWVTVNNQNQFIRVLNIKLSKTPHRILQVGFVVSQSLLAPSYLSGTSLVFLAIALVLGFVVAWFLTSILFAPIQQLESFVTIAASQVLEIQEVPPIPATFKRSHSNQFRRGDEFDRLLSGLDVLIDRINRTYKLTRLWTYQMAHELKTPLAILGVEMQKLSTVVDARGRSTLSEMESVMQKMESTISSFLNWAELERHDQLHRIHANRIGHVLSEIVAQMEQLFEARLVITEQEEDFYVLCDREHLKQALINLIANALQYSQGKVEVTLKNHTITVRDFGPGIAQDIVARLGEPFNRGTLEKSHSKQRGHGLGLAWVHTIARRYQWNFTIQRTTPQGTQATIEFPKN